MRIQGRRLTMLAQCRSDTSLFTRRTRNTITQAERGVCAVPHSQPTRKPTAIGQFSLSWVSEGFFPEGANSGLFQVEAKSIYSGGETVVKFHFTNSKLTEKLKIDRKISNILKT